MYEIKSKTISIEGHRVELFKREVCRCNVLEVTAGTNGYQGGDSGHGSRTYLRLKDLGGTDISVKPLVGKYGDEGVEIVLGGDSELATIIEALKFAVKVLEDQKEGVCD
jgi:hypothetical protein